MLIAVNNPIDAKKAITSSLRSGRGDTITLHGNFRDWRPYDFDFTGKKRLTIVAAPDCDWQGFFGGRFANVAFSGKIKPSTAMPAFRADSISDVVFDHLEITANDPAKGQAMALSNAARLDFDTMHVHDIHQGICGLNATDWRIHNHLIERMGNDAIQIFAFKNLTIEDGVTRYPMHAVTDQDHPDGAQTRSAASPCLNYIFRRNYVQSRGQGIYLGNDLHIPVAYRHVSITDNIVIAGTRGAIHVWDADDVTVTGNHVYTNPEHDYPADIVLRGACSNVRNSGNTVHPVGTAIPLSTLG